MAAYDTDLVLELEPEDVADLFVTLTMRIGQLGRDAREAIIAKADTTSDPDFNEGMAQLSDLFDTEGG